MPFVIKQAWTFKLEKLAASQGQLICVGKNCNICKENKTPLKILINEIHFGFISPGVGTKFMKVLGICLCKMSSVLRMFLIKAEGDASIGLFDRPSQT